jgi:hypothetical protein
MRCSRDCRAMVAAALAVRGGFFRLGSSVTLITPLGITAGMDEPGVRRPHPPRPAVVAT